jgi:rhodanese-related sulfurtransferase
MKYINFPVIVLLLILSTIPVYSQETAFDTFLSHFDYETREDMKIDSKELVPLLRTGKAVLVDIRFPEEVAAWRTGFAAVIPLNELPARFKELPRNKIIVTACPHKDRSAIAMTYLRTQGYNARYLTDGLVGLAEYLRGDRAKDFVEALGLVNQKRQ